MSELETIAGMLAKLQKQEQSDSGMKLKAFEGLLSDISTALGDMVGLLEREKPAQEANEYAPLVAAIKGIRIEAPQVTVEPRIEVNVPAQPAAAAPKVDVTVQPAPVHNAITVQPAEVHVMERQQTGPLEFEFHYVGSMLTGATVKRA